MHSELAPPTPPLEKGNGFRETNLFCCAACSCKNALIARQQMQRRLQTGMATEQVKVAIRPGALMSG